MKNKNIFLKIYIPFLIICFITFIILSILGKKNRVGYLGEFKFDEYHIENTLQLNGFDIDETKKLFTIDNILDNDALTNYIFTNEAITNYSYGFRVKYYDKVFRNSDIYGVYIDTNKLINDNNFIKSIKMEAEGSPFGSFISDKIIDFEKIDNINYKLEISHKLLHLFVSVNIFIFVIIFSVKLLRCYYSNIVYYDDSKLIFNKDDYLFIIVSGIIVIAIFLFQYWLCFPGYFQYWDTWEVIWRGYTGDYDDWRPVIISFVLRIIYSIFGYDTYYLFLINLLCWYIGLYIIVISAYLKFKNRLVIFMLLFSFIGNIFFTNINSEKDFTATLIVWLSLSIMFFELISFRNSKVLLFLKIFSIFLLFIAELWRHNFIVTVYPLFFVYLVININRIVNIRKYIKSFLGLAVIIAVILIMISQNFSLFFVNGSKSYSNHILLLQIAGCAFYSNDYSLIPDNWYIDDKNSEDLKKLYIETNLIGDKYVTTWNENAPFYYFNLENIKQVWIKYIIKHPISYLKHMINYTAYMWTTEAWSPALNGFNYRMTVDEIQDNAPLHVFTDEFYNASKNKGIVFTPLREKIYTLLYTILPSINILIFVIFSILIFFISIFIFIRYRIFRNNNFLLFSFFTSFSAFATSIIVALFTPVPLYRYIHPVSAITIISLISFITFIYDRGGFKKFIQELRGSGK